MYAYGLHTFIHAYIHFHWKEHGHANERQIVSRSHYATPPPPRVYHAPTTLVLRQCRSYYAGTTSMPFLLRWYYVDLVLTTLSLGPYHALWRYAPTA